VGRSQGLPYTVTGRSVGVNQRISRMIPLFLRNKQAALHLRAAFFYTTERGTGVPGGAPRWVVGAPDATNISDSRVPG